MAVYDFDLGIIGGGAAGLTAAAGGARLGAKTLLIEREPHLGGDCLHYGCVPSKTLIASAKVYHTMRNAQQWGLPSVDPGPVDFTRVAERIRGVIARIQRHDSPQRFCQLGAKVVFGSPEFIDEHSLRVGGETFSAEKWLVATGSSPAVPNIPGLKDVSYLTNRDLWSLDELPESLIILGGGAVAVEMAQAFQRLGSIVTILQRSRQLLSGEDSDIAGMVAAKLRQEGVSVRLNAHVTTVGEAFGQKEVWFADDTGMQRLVRAKALLVAMGRAPNVTGLGLHNAGVAYTEKGVPTDRRLRTSSTDIYAAGDVLGKWQFTHAAGYEAGVALTNAVARLPRKANYQFMPVATYCDPELAGVGMTYRQARAADLDVTTHVQPFAENDRALAENTPDGVIKMVVDSQGQVLGVRILGPRAGDLIGEWVTVLSGGVRLSKLAQSVHPYPTLGEINRRAAGEYLAPKVFEGVAPKLLKVIFGLKGRACELPGSQDAVKG